MTEHRPDSWRLFYTPAARTPFRVIRALGLLLIVMAMMAACSGAGTTMPPTVDAAAPAPDAPPDAPPLAVPAVILNASPVSLAPGGSTTLT